MLLHATPSVHDRAALRARLLDLWERTGDPALQLLADGKPPRADAVVATEQDRIDWLSTSLMDAYKNTGDSAVFELLYDLNRGSFQQAIQSKLRRTHQHLDGNDVLQDVFLNIYRYPHRFHADRADAFRNWGHRIVRNTLLKALKGEARILRQRCLEDELQLPEDPRARSPERAASEAESALVVNRAFCIYIQLYLRHFEALSPRERMALTLVEVDGVSYKDAAAQLGIRLENLKMVIFRGRRKIFRGMAHSLEQMGAEQAARN